MKNISGSVTEIESRLRRIEGRHNGLVKQLRLAFSLGALTDTGECAIEGLRIVEEAIRSGVRFHAVFFRESSENLTERLLPQLGAQVETILLPDRLFDTMMKSESPQGVAALVRPKSFSIDHILERAQIGPIIVLAGLQDPGNLGTILRSAEAFGSAGVILGEGSVSPFNSKVVRASAGSIFRLPVVREREEGKRAPRTQNGILPKLRAHGIHLIATSSHKGSPVDRANLNRPCAIFFGNEGAGLPRDLMAEMDEFVAIPHSEQVESLNAGVAASIVLYEAAKQRG